MIISVNPYTQEKIGEYALLSSQEIEQKLEKSEQTFHYWKRTALQERKELFLKLAQKLRAEKTTLALLLTNEMGKTLRESEAEIEKCAVTIEYYVENVTHFLEDWVIPIRTHESFVSYEPIGTILAVMPWNFPFWQALRFAIPTLLAGNVGVLKHASNVMGCAEAMERLFLESGFPEGVFQNLVVGSGAVSSIIRHSAIKAVTLTGSETAGRAVAREAADCIKKSVLELGGSDPFVVLKDANLYEAAKAAVKSRFQNAGQTCIAAKRWIVEKEVKEEFTALVLNEAQRLRQGNPLEAATDMGPMAKPQLVDDLKEQLRKSLENNAVLLLGGESEGCNFQPTILDNIQAGDVAFVEETFGPLGCLIEAKDEKNAILLANQTNFGLGASLWTRDLDRAKHLSRTLEAGVVHVNSMVKSDPAVPFGGTKRSGYGRELSVLGMHEFMNIKTVWITN